MKEKLDFYSKTSLKSYNLNESMRYQLGMLDSLDAFTRVHSENVANLTCRLCEYMKLNKAFTVYCTICAYLHDIGKIAVPSEILNKPDKLTAKEFNRMKAHAFYTNSILSELNVLADICAWASNHHEKTDGSGYPFG